MIYNRQIGKKIKLKTCFSIIIIALIVVILFELLFLLAIYTSNMLDISENYAFICLLLLPIIDIRFKIVKIAKKEAITLFHQFDWLAIPEYSVQIGSSLLYGGIITCLISLPLKSAPSALLQLYPIISILLFVLFSNRNSLILKCNDSYYISSHSGLLPYTHLDLKRIEIRENIWRQRIRYDIILDDKLIGRINPGEFKSDALSKIKTLVCDDNVKVIENLEDTVDILDPCRLWTRKE